MHELSIALNILDIAAEQSARHAGADVLAIHLRLGELSGVVEQALASAFDIARRDSAYVDTQLVIEAIPITVFCEHCCGERPVESTQRMCCAVCGELSAMILQGRDLEIVSMEIALPASHDPAVPTPFKA